MESNSKISTKLLLLSPDEVLMVSGAEVTTRTVIGFGILGALCPLAAVAAAAVYFARQEC